MNTIKTLIITQQLYNACEQENYVLPENMIENIASACVYEYTNGYEKAGYLLINRLLQLLHDHQKIYICYIIAASGSRKLINLITSIFPQSEYFLFIQKNKYSSSFTDRDGLERIQSLSQTVNTAAYHNNIEFIEWYTGRRGLECNFSADVYTTACETGAIDSLKLLHLRQSKTVHMTSDDSCNWTCETTKTAIENRNIDCYKYCIDNGCKYNLRDIPYISSIDLMDHWWRDLLFMRTNELRLEVAEHVNIFFEELKKVQHICSKILHKQQFPYDLSKWILENYL